jgi:DNA/RNA-binding domain of Phe-tRNA-synthetase-like protein
VDNDNPRSLTATDQRFVATPSWHAALPGAVAGALVMRGLANPDRHDGIDAARTEAETTLRQRYTDRDRAALRATPPLPAYEAYYRRFGQTYHVLLQLESVALKGKPLPRRPPLVEAMFLAELDSLILTAGHDLAALESPVVVDVAGPDEHYQGIGGKEQPCKPGDFLMRDDVGIICSIIQGPDDRTKITRATREALFAVYAPPGIGAEPVRRHLEAIAANARLISPDAKVVDLITIRADAASG